MYQRRWRRIHAFIGRNTIALRVQRFAAGANIICLTYATDWWAVIGPVIHGESKSEATRSSSDHVGLLHTLSTIDTLKSQNSGCVLYWSFWPNWWSEKIRAGNSQSRGVSYIRCAYYIRDKKVSNFIPYFTEHVITYPCWDWGLSMLGYMHHFKGIAYPQTQVLVLAFSSRPPPASALLPELAPAAEYHLMYK